ncbi:7-cyano-7-deazaguanine synthase QueC [bacterium]|nr:7-cyano-7-deazaguanine synthase QueC [candidate division CSSED10-310 bacterium]
MDRSLAVVLSSGGMDSCVVAALAARNHQLAMLHVSYGQRTWMRELRAFNDICDHLDVKLRLKLNMNHFALIGGSSLTDPSIPVPEGGTTDTDIPATYVPFRNATLLCAAVSWAEIIRAGKIFIGVNEMDIPGYPDCRPEFIRAFNQLIKTGTRPQTNITIETPLSGLKKSDIVRLGIAISAPLEKSWSCYRSEDLACGTCDSCRLRLSGFRDAGYRDPVIYREGPGTQDR